jgi:hypothetical protein
VVGNARARLGTDKADLPGCGVGVRGTDRPGWGPRCDQLHLIELRNPINLCTYSGCS